MKTYDVINFLALLGELPKTTIHSVCMVENEKRYRNKDRLKRKQNDT